MNDQPLTFELAKHEREVAFHGRVAIEFPATKHKRRFIAQQSDFKFGERQRAHQVTARVARLVPFDRGLPSAGDLSAGRKRQLFGFPIALHEAIDVAGIPGGLLFGDHRRDVVRDGLRESCCVVCCRGVFCCPRKQV